MQQLQSRVSLQQISSLRRFIIHKKLKRALLMKYLDMYGTLTKGYIIDENKLSRMFK